MLTLFLASTLLVSCQSIDGPSEDNSSKGTQDLVDVKVQFSGLDITTTPISRASDKAADETSVKRINLAVYDSNGKLILDTIQNKSVDPTNFGKTITLRIPVGSNKFVAVAHNSNTADATATINSSSEVSLGTQSKLDPTFTKVQDINISGNTTQAVGIDFGTRRNAKFTVCITDDTPSDVQKIEIIISPTANDYTDLKIDPSTGYATSTWRYRVVIDLADYPGVTTFTNASLHLPLLLTGATQKANVTINALASDDTVLYTRTLTDVSFQQGHQTKATGTFFSPETSTSFSFDTSVIIDNISLD